MAQAADAAIAKIENILPDHLLRLVSDRSLWAPATNRRAPLAFDLSRLRAAIRACMKVRFRYSDEKRAETHRTVRPLTLWFYPPIWLAGAWCELRKDFRFFRLERMREVEFLDDVFPQEPGKSAEDLFRRTLLKG